MPWSATSTRWHWQERFDRLVLSCRFRLAERMLLDAGKGGIFASLLPATRHKKVHVIQIPVAPELTKIIAATPTGDITFLMNKWAKPVHRQRIRQLVSRPLQLCRDCVYYSQWAPVPPMMTTINPSGILTIMI